MPKFVGVVNLRASEIRRTSDTRRLIPPSGCCLRPRYHFPGGFGVISADPPVDLGEIAPGACGETNEVCHARLQTPRKRAESPARTSWNAIPAARCLCASAETR